MVEAAPIEVPEKADAPRALDDSRRAHLAVRVTEYAFVAASFCFAIVTLLDADRNIEPTSLTDSWLSVLHVAFARRLVWGRDVVFTYGPWGFLFGGTRRETLGWWLGGRLLIAGAFWYALWRFARGILPRPIVRALWVCLGAALIAWGEMDLQIMAVPLLLLVVGVQRERRSRAMLILLCFAAGLCGWIKPSAGITCVGVVGVVTLMDLFLRRRPIVLPLFAFASLAFHLLAHQPLGALLDYARNQWEIMVGYGAAMQATSSQAPWIMSFYGATSIVLIAMVSLLRLPSSRVTSLFCVAITGWFLVIFKECFVRQDQQPHMQIAAPALLLALFILVMQPSAWRRSSIALGIAAFILATLTANGPHSNYVSYPAKAVANVFAETPRHAKRVAAIVASVFGSNTSPQKIVDDEYPPITGPVDAIPWTGPYAFDQLHFRPDFQSYSVYTPRLAEINAEFLRRPDAPPKLLWRVNPLEGNYATMEDPLIWAEALASYRYTGDVAGQLVLSRKERRPYEMIRLSETAGSFGQVIDVPPSPSGRLWLKMQITPTRLGAFRALVYRPAELRMTTETASGASNHYKLIVPIMSCGFLLSPQLNDSYDFKALISGDRQHLLAPNAIKRISIAPEDPGSFVGYDSTLIFQFFDLELK